MTRIFAPILLILALTAGSAAAGTDPRRCSIGTTVKTPAYCGNLNARLAIRRAHGNGDISCTPAAANLLTWRCVYNGQPQTWRVTFRALSNGWHTLVAVNP